MRRAILGLVALSLVATAGHGAAAKPAGGASAAFKALSQPLGQQMSKILKYDVTKAPQCLTCHAVDKYPGMAIPKELNAAERFDIDTDGEAPWLR